jgi:hypothetical protein
MTDSLIYLCDKIFHPKEIDLLLVLISPWSNQTEEHVNVDPKKTDGTNNRNKDISHCLCTS